MTFRVRLLRRPIHLRRIGTPRNDKKKQLVLNSDPSPRRYLSPQYDLGGFNDDKNDEPENDDDGKVEERRFRNAECLLNRWDLDQYGYQHKLPCKGYKKPLVRGCLEDTVYEGTAVKGDNKLYNNKQEENLCPCMCYISELVEEE